MKIGGVVEQSSLALYVFCNVPDEPGIAGEILSLFSKAGINLEYITETMDTQGKSIISFCVHQSIVSQVDNVLKNTQLQYFDLKISKIENVQMFGVYGPHFREKPAIASRFCCALGSIGVNILNLSSSISTIAAIIREEDGEKAKNAVLKLFELP